MASAARSQRLLEDDSAEYGAAPFAAGSTGRSISDRIRTMPRWVLGVIILVLVIAFIAIIAAIAAAMQKHSDNESRGDSGGARSQTDIDQCLADHATTRHPIIASGRQSDGRTPRVLIQNATVYDGMGALYRGYDILMEGGLIIGFGQGLSTDGATVVNVRGRWATPGLVDLHSHIGVYSWLGDLWATQDGNELTNPVTPQMRALDAFDPEDPAIDWILQGGVITSQVLPGSGNTMGGEAIVIKHKNSSYVNDLLVPQAPRALKMACGENPKRVYGAGMGVTPGSRMGNAWVMRQAFEQARTLMTSQRLWCSVNNPTGAFPDSIALHSLVALLSHQARLHQHCYKIHDFQMILRLADEFGYYVSAFHHASEAWKIPNLLKNITVATWADWWGFKAESFDGSVYEPAILEKNGVAVVIKSDDDVVSNYLAFEAAKAHAYGLSENGSIIAITSQPAFAMGLQNRIGSIKVGLDADVLVWDNHPLVLGARPEKIFIEGALAVDRGINSEGPQVYPATAGDLSQCTNNQRQQSLDCFIINSVDVYTMTDDPQPRRSVSVLVINGTVQCVDVNCQAPLQCTLFQLPNTGGVIIPGLIESGSHVGQQEIDGESATTDGANSGSGIDSYSPINSFDGIHVSGRHVDSARKGGVLTAINPPMVGSQLVVGLSTAFHTLTRTNNGDQHTFIDDVNIQQRVALHISVGNSAKINGITQSFSGQIAALRASFAKAKGVNNSGQLLMTDPNWAFVQVLAGNLPLSVDVNSADQIAALLRLQKEYAFRLIIQGGAEAHLLASQLAASNTAVILTSRVPPSSYETQRASDRSLSILRAAGVSVGLQAASDDNARNLRWEVGWQQVFAEGNMTTYEALKLVTTNIVSIFGITSDIDSGSPARGTATAWADGLGQVKVGSLANFVLVNGNPLGVESTIQLVALGRDVECKPQQR